MRLRWSPLGAQVRKTVDSTCAFCLNFSKPMLRPHWEVVFTISPWKQIKHRSASVILSSLVYGTPPLQQSQRREYSERSHACLFQLAMFRELFPLTYKPIVVSVVNEEP
jgi:hypothetical protein